jgi:hypothetical protein
LASPTFAAFAAFAVALITYATLPTSGVVCGLSFHPLRRFPSLRFAATSEWWKTHLEVFQQKSMCHKLPELHKLCISHLFGLNFPFFFEVFSIPVDF